MARFTPEGWRPSQAAVAAYTEHREEVERIVGSESRVYYNLPAIDRDDLAQEGRWAALYALDSYAPERGKRGAYVRRVVKNALAMVACEATAQCRQAYTWVKEDDTVGYERCEVGQETPGAPVGYREISIPGGWRRVAVSEPSEPDMVRSEAMGPARGMEDREREMESIRATVASRQRVAALRCQLSPVAQRVMDLRLNPPMELLVAARNIIGRSVSEEAKMPNAALARYAQLTVQEVQRALKEIREALGALRGAVQMEVQP